MSFNDTLIVCFVLAFSLLVNSERQEFCQTFADNDFNIDYGYQSDYWTHHFLVIGPNYWQIEWEGDRARLISGLSRTTDLLGHKYRTAFLSNFSSDGKLMGYSMTGRLFRHNNTIDWVSIRFNRITGQLVKSGDNRDYTVSRTEIGFKPDFNPSISLVISLGTICFLLQRPALIVFEGTFRCFHFDFLTGSANNADNRVIENLKRKMERQNITYGSDDMILNNLRDSREVIAILSETHFSDFRYLFLFKESKAITYCLIDSLHFIEGVSRFPFVFNPNFDSNVIQCQTEPEVLISCSDYEKQQSMTTFWKTGEEVVSVLNSHQSYVTVLWRYKDIFVLVLGFVVLIVILLMIRKPRESQPVLQL